MCFILCFFVVFKTVLFLPRRQRAGPGRAGPELNGPGRAEKNGPVQASSLYPIKISLSVKKHLEQALFYVIFFTHIHLMRCLSSM